MHILTITISDGFAILVNFTMLNVASMKKQKMTQKVLIFRIFCELSRKMPL